MRHDTLLRLLAMEDPEAVTALVLAPMPDAVRRRLPERLFEPVPTEHIVGALRRVSIDCLLLMPLAADRDLIVIVEGKSFSDPETPSQLDRYYRAVRRWYRKRYQKRNGSRREPVILLLVAYNGRRKWTLSFGMSKPEEVAWLLGHLLDGGFPVGNYVLLDLVHKDWNWEARVSGFEARMMLAALSWQPSDGEEAVRELIRAIPEGDDLEWQLGGYFAGERGMDAGFMERTWYHLKPHLRRHPKMKALRDEWKDEGRAEGKAEGKAEGRVEGRVMGQVEGKAEALQRLMERRFGALAPQARAQIEAATLEQLDSWFDEVLDADSVEAVLANGRAH